MKIQEIAEKAGVSTATVSRVFSHHPNIREEIRERVFAVSRQYGYYPRLSTKQRNIVIVTPSKSLYPIRSYVDMVLSELASELSARGYRIEMLPADNLERLGRIQFCGAVAVGMDESVFQDWDERYAVPLVMVDRPVSRKTANVFSVHSDEKQAMELAIGHLAENGCKKIGCIVHGKTGVGNVDVRTAGIFAALEKHGLPFTSNLVRTALTEEYVEEIGKLIRLGIDGLFCPGGNSGIVTSYALSLYGKRVPDEISLVASERTIFSRYAIPPQTTISQDYETQAKAVADVLEHCTDRKRFPKNTVIPYRLIERDSVLKH